jgi:hypothetical protein
MTGASIEGSELSECTQPAEEVAVSQGDSLSPDSSGKNLAIQRSMFPELVDTVVQAISVSLLSIVLQKAFSNFPEQVEPAIADLKDQHGICPLRPDRALQCLTFNA